MHLKGSSNKRTETASRVQADWRGRGSEMQSTELDQVRIAKRALEKKYQFKLSEFFQM